MSRYFVRCKFKGSNYSGWQSQPNSRTVQDELEDRVEKLLGKKTSIVGCGRTDAGVHASDYFFHLNSEKALNEQFIFKMNMMLPDDIAIVALKAVNTETHARFDAISRSYQYKIHRNKNPFLIGLSYYYPHLFRHDLKKLNEVAEIYLNQTDFYPFCKTKTDVKTTLCEIFESRWEVGSDSLIFHVKANRFLRGMVRLMVGACINVTLGKLKKEEIETAFTERRRLKKDLSVPAEGLFLSNIEYPNNLI